MKKAPTDDLAWRVAQAAGVKLRGKPKDNFLMLEPLIEQLNGLGFAADFIQLTADKMDEVVLKRAEAEHKQEQKGWSQSRRTDLDTSKLPKAEPDAMYYGGWLVRDRLPCYVHRHSGVLYI